jgi:hypothetical protein
MLPRRRTPMRTPARSLRFQLPNPPAVFVGREREAARLAELLDRGAVAVVCGAGGLGKSALAQYVVHRRMRASAPVVVRCRKEDEFEQLGLDVLQALTQLRLVEGGFESKEELAAGVLDLAERDGRLVVLEDLHHLPPADRDRWLDLLSSYARESRWIATLRERPSLPGIQEQIVELAPLSKTAALELARSCRREADENELAALAEASDGSPFWIRQLAARAGHASAPRDLLDGLSDEAVRYLAMLSILEEPMRDELASASAATREALEARGMIVSDAETHRLHDVAVEHVIGSLSEGERAQAHHDAATALGSAPLARAQLEAFRLLLVQRDLDHAVDLLSSYRAWIGDGLGPRLWTLLAKETDARFDQIKLRIALDVGSDASLSWLVARSAPDAPEDRLLWAHGLLRSGRPRQALDALHAITTQEDEVQILRARAMCDAGYAEDAVDLLREIEPSSPADRARRDLHLAKALYHADDSEGSARMLERVRRELDALPPTVARELSGERRGMLMQLGLRDEVSDDPGEETRGWGVQSLVYYALRLAGSGRFGGSSKLLERVTQTGDLPAGSSVLSGVFAGVLRVPKGEFRGLDTVATHLVQEAEQLGNATLYHWAYMLERLVNLGRAQERPEIPWSPSIPLPTGVPERYLRVLRASHAARRGERVSEDEMPRARPGDGPLVECVCQLSEAHVRLLSGDPERAAFLAAQVSRKLAREGYDFFEGEAVLIRAYAELVLGRTVELARGVEELSNVGAASQSRRYTALARLLRTALAEEPDVPVLLATRHEGDSAPAIIRVAAALLGVPNGCDAQDRLIADAMLSRWRSRVVPLSADRAPTWVVDPATRTVHLPGRSVDASPLAIKILEGLFVNGGRATLAELAALGWDIDEYHQLRDSKRVHVAIRRLRTLIEDDPSTPTRVITTEEGYELASSDPPGLLRPA